MTLSELQSLMEARGIVRCTLRFPGHPGQGASVRDASACLEARDGSIVVAHWEDVQGAVTRAFLNLTEG